MAHRLTGEEHIEQPRLWFPEDVAPFGELNLIKASHARATGGISMGTLFTMSTPRIIRDAWAGSQWLAEEIGDEKLAEFTSDPDASEPVVKALDSDLLKATYRPRNHAAWFAIRPPKAEEERMFPTVRGLSAYTSPSQVVGFANGKHDVSGTFTEQVIKRWRHPEKVYAAVSNVNVLPEEQHRRIGHALFYAMLGSFKPDQRPTTYVAASNTALRDYLTKNLGYEETGSRPRTDLIPGASIEEVRLQADTAREVRQRLAFKLPWLKEAVATRVMLVDI